MERAGKLQSLVACLRLDRLVALELQDVARELPAPLIILDDQNQLAGHGLSGSETVNVEPMPTSL